MIPGSEIIIIRGPGHGDSTLATIPGMAGALGGDTIRAGLITALVTRDGGMVTGAAGGVLLFIIRPIGEDGMAAQDLMVIMEIHTT